jgi:serine/threonine protein kinase
VEFAMPMLNVGAGKNEWITPRYEACELIDETGSFAEVYRAHDLHYSVGVALKVYKKPVTDGKANEQAKREIAILKMLKGSEFFPDRATSLIHFFNKQRHHVLVMELGEYCWQEEPSEEDAAARRHPCKDIFSLNQIVPQLGSAATPPKHRPEFWNASHLTGWVADLCEAVRLMHDRKVLHLDLKPTNILLKRVAGRERSVPFLIDFNTSVEPGAAKFEGATEDYRAPEVRFGTRKIPAVADDLYALALILTEIHFGLGSHKRSRDAQLKPHAQIPYAVENLRKVLLRALDNDPEKRFATALDLKQAIIASLAAGPAGLSSEEMAHIRKEAPRIRENIEEIFTGHLTLYVSKHLRDEVASLFSNLSAEATDSLDLRERLLALGQKAVPAIFEEGYKLDMNSPHFPIVVEALAEFGRLEDARLKDHPNDFVPNRVTRSLDDYRLSSNYVVRRLCRELCRTLGIFPDGQREILREGSDVLLPDERNEVVELCLACGTAETDLRALLLYMCDEFFADAWAYGGLRREVADRIVEMKVQNKAGLIGNLAYERLWEESREYQEIAAADRPDRAVGVFQLFGDAFASLREEALRALQAGGVRLRNKGGNPPWLLWQPFAIKLARTFPAARDWVLAVKAPPMGVTYESLEQTQAKVTEDRGEPDPNIEKLFQDYKRLGGSSLLNQLVRSPRLGEILKWADDAAVNDPSAIARILDLLRRCRSEGRQQALSIAFRHYPVFAAANYRDLIGVIFQNKLRDRQMRKEAEKQLEADINVPERSELATEWLNRLLEDD